MKHSALTCCVALVAGLLLAEPPAVPPDGASAAMPATQPAKADSSDGPSIQLEGPESEPAPLLPTAELRHVPTATRPVTGAALPECITTISRDPTGRWSTIKDSRGNVYNLMPCRWLETIEDSEAVAPSRYRLSGAVYHYGGESYLMLTKVLVLGPAATSQPVATQSLATAPADSAPPGSVDPTPTTAATQATATSSSSDGASAEDVARTLLRETGKPMIPVTLPPSPAKTVPSVAPPNAAIRPGPGRMVVDRLARVIRPEGSDWFVLAFESDNTLTEPPMRILPNEWLDRAVNMTVSLKERGAVFHVSGEVHRYRQMDYVLLRSVIRKRSMSEF